MHDKKEENNISSRKDYRVSNDLDKLREIVRNMTECPKLRARAMWKMMMMDAK